MQEILLKIYLFSIIMNVEKFMKLLSSDIKSFHALLSNLLICNFTVRK